MEKRTTINCCPGSGCHAGCLHRTHVVDGKIVKVEPLTYPDGEKGVICVKGYAGPRVPYHPDRLKHPLKRVGKRGEGKWEQITWEQALDEIADQIIEIRGKYNPESILIHPFYSSSPVSEIQNMLGVRLRNLLEATDMNRGNPVDSGPAFSCFFTHGAGLGHLLHPKVLTDGNTKYMIVWGSNPAETAYKFWRYIKEARKKGAKLVDIGLVQDPTAKTADWFIQVKAGSDGALGLAMIDVIIKEALYDEDYIIQHTNGPFLVRTDNGRLLRESDISPEASAQSYVVWDLGTGRPKAVMPYSPCPEGTRPALLGSYNIGEVECKPAFQLLSDLAARISPKQAAEITGVSHGTIANLAREYATTKPAAILIGCGLRYANSGNAYRTMDTLGAITGNIGVTGGGTIMGGNTPGQLNAPLLRLNDDAIYFPTEATSREIPVAHVLQGIVTGKPYPMKALISYGSNLHHTFPHPKRWVEEILPNLELIVVNDIFMTATAENADYVLPDCTVFEREDMDFGGDNYIVWLDKAIEPMYECRPAIYFWSELAKRLGFGEYFDKTIDEWAALRFASDDPSVTGIDPPLTVERLKKEKIIRANVPTEAFNPWLPKVFPTPSGRVELYNEELQPAGDSLPVYREQAESPRSALAEKYPLVFNTANPKYFVHSMFANDPKMLEKYLNEPHLSINPADATKRNINDDDLVTAYNDRGSFKAKALITRTVPPGVVAIPHGWWPRQFVEGHLQNLVQSLATNETRDLSREIMWELASQKQALTGAKAFLTDTFISYSPDTLFDCLCQVERVEEG